MDLAIQHLSSDKIIKFETIHDLKEYILQTLLTETRSGLFVAMLPFIKNWFLMGLETIKLSTENNILTNKLGEYDAAWFEETRAKQIKIIGDE